MIVLLMSAFVMGGIGSLHCIGMCGPLALSLPVKDSSLFSKFFSGLLYNSGRVVTYAGLGAAIGVVGMSFSIFGFQQWLSITAGSLIIIYLLFPKLLLYKNGNLYFQRVLGKLRSRLSVLFKVKKYSSVFFIGLLNGLLPCGLVYMSMAAAIATGSVLKSSLFMAAFGAGTLPLMWALVFFGANISLQARSALRNIYPYLLFVMACLLIVRGLGLHIPYLSPQWQPGTELTQQAIGCHN